MSGSGPLPAAGEPIDLDHLDRQTLGDRAIRDEVLDMFLRDMASLRVQLDETSGDARARLAHRIRGTALGIGANALAECAARLNADPERNDIADTLVERADEAVRYVSRIRGQPAPRRG